MAIASSIDESRDLTVFTVDGELTFDAQIATLQRFYGGSPTANVIWDFRSLEGNRLNASELRKIIDFIKRYESKRPAGKTALVSITDLDFGLSSVVGAYADVENVPWEIRAFRSLDAALGWIEDETR